MVMSCKNLISKSLAAAAAAALSAGIALAGMLDAPEGDVIMTVSGNVHATNAGDTAVFDLEMLEALPVTEFTTTTIWTEGEQTFTGVELGTFLEAVKANGMTLEAKAINDYAIEVPVTDAVEGGPILAYKMNGAYMSRREKGPVWLVYPYDHKAGYRSETIYSRSIWQLDRLTVK